MTKLFYLAHNIYLVKNDLYSCMNGLARNIKTVFIPVLSSQSIFSGQKVEASILDRHNCQAYLLFLIAKFDNDLIGVK